MSVFGRAAPIVQNTELLSLTPDYCRSPPRTTPPALRYHSIAFAQVRYPDHSIPVHTSDRAGTEHRISACEPRSCPMLRPRASPATFRYHSTGLIKPRAAATPSSLIHPYRARTWHRVHTEESREASPYLAYGQRRRGSFVCPRLHGAAVPLHRLVGSPALHRTGLLHISCQVRTLHQDDRSFHLHLRHSDLRPCETTSTLPYRILVCMLPSLGFR